MTDRRVIAVFAEGAFEDAFLRPTLAEALAFADGCRTGAGYYGAGSCAAFVLPEDDAEMDEEAANQYSDLTTGEVEKARRVAAEKIEQARLVERG